MKEILNLNSTLMDFQIGYFEESHKNIDPNFHLKLQDKNKKLIENIE